MRPVLSSINPFSYADHHHARSFPDALINVYISNYLAFVLLKSPHEVQALRSTGTKVIQSFHEAGKQ
jgi:hypothetical protein